MSSTDMKQIARPSSTQQISEHNRKIKVLIEIIAWVSPSQTLEAYQQAAMTDPKPKNLMDHTRRHLPKVKQKQI